MKEQWLGLKDKVVVITGAAGGMGQEFCRAFAKQGAQVVLLDLQAEAINQLADELTKEYQVATLALPVDTTNKNAVVDAVHQVVDRFRRIDILVNTAAILRFSPLEDLKLSEWQQQLDINLTGYFLVAQQFGRQMIKQKAGTMVHISTVADTFPETYSGAYSVTKAGVTMLSKQIAAEWGQFGIRSNCVCPCLVKTPMSESFYADPEVEQGRSRLVASKRIGNLTDITNAVLYLASDRSDYTNGASLRVDGGISVMMQDMIPKPHGRRQYAIEHHQK